MKRIIIVTMIFAAFLSACKKEENAGTSRFTLKLTDAPALYDKVNLDLQGVSVIVNDTVINLDVKTGVFNLLDLVNGKDTLIVDQEIPAGRLSQIRLILGNNNNLQKGTSTYALSTPSAQQSGLKLNVQNNFVQGVAYAYTIDFDAARSIVRTGNNGYILKPVLRVFTNAVSGAIKGVVAPSNSKPVVYAISGNQDTLTTYADTTSGQFMFKGVPAGTYKLDIVPVSPFTEKALTNVTVTNGNVTSVDTIRIQ